jgi:UDP-N-acetylmuramate dehydrogenase
MIDQAGLKGTWIGGARVSPLHANFMVTKEGASAADVLALIALVRERVHAQFGVDLVLEVQPIGR